MTTAEANKVISDMRDVEAWVARRYGVRAATKLWAGPDPDRIREFWAGIETNDEQRFWQAAQDARRAAEALGYVVVESGGYDVNAAAVSLSAGLSGHGRLAGVSDMEAANALLSAFVADYNARFAKVPARPDDLHRPLNAEPDRLREILCLRDQRYVCQDLALKYDRRRIVLEVNDLTRDLPGRYVDTYEFADGRLQVRVKGVVIPFTAFDPDQQRVSQAAITENKHLTAVLAHIKAEQDARPPPKVQVRPRSANGGYKPTGRRNDGWNSKLAIRHKARQAAEAAARVADHDPDP